MTEIAKTHKTPELYGLALSYKNSADILAKDIICHEFENSLPAKFLYSHSVELILKSYLLFKGLTLDELSKRPYGHDLIRIYRECLNRGLQLSNSDQSTIRYLLDLLVAGHNEYKFRYSSNSLTSATLEMTSRETTKLFTSICAEIDQSRTDYEQSVNDAGMVLISIPTGLSAEIG